jgi:hypothetical protein
MPAVNVCQHCGGEIEEGKSVCPHCGKAVAAEGATWAAGGEGREGAPPPRVVTAPMFTRPAEPADNSRRVIYAVVALVALALIGGLAYLATRPSARPGEEHLTGAIRPGSPDFPSKERLMVDFEPDDDATIGANALGNFVVTMKPTIRNFTGRTVNGLEFHAAGLDLKGQVIRERSFVTETEIEPNKTSSPAIGLNFPADNKPAQLKLELTGVRFK